MVSPRANGMCERAQATIIERLLTLCPDESTWDKYLQQVMVSINNSVSATIKYSPHELFHGYKLRMTNESFLVHEIEDDPADTSGETHLRDIRVKADQNIKKVNAEIIEKNSK